MIKREEVNPEGEFLLLSNMIMSTEVLAASYNRYKSKELKTNHFTTSFRPVFRWLVQYYGHHRKAPKRTIETIFERRGRSLGEEAQELVGEYLERLAEEYSEYEDEAIDPDYIRAEVLTDFIRERELAFRLEKAQDRLDQGKIKDAENLVSSYISVSEEETDPNLGIIIPFTEEDVEENFKVSLGDKTFRFDGDLGWVVGDLCKSWLVALMGVEKSGKSFVAQEIGYQAALFQKKKVLIINLELNEILARNRLWRRISQTTDKQNVGKAVYPVLDCQNNQNGTCKILKRLKNKKPLFSDPDSKAKTLWVRNRKWKVCQKCRGNTKRWAAMSKKFVPTVWWDQTDKKIREVTELRVKRAIKKKQLYNLRNLRIKCFPRFSVTFDEVEEFIYRYIDKFKWKPHIVIFDYLDILAPEPGNLPERIDIDRKWKKASKLAGELNTLVITPDQANKAGRTAYMLDQMSTSESKTKDSHLDVRIALNQTNNDKAVGIARMNILFHRHVGFDIKREVITTQRLQTAEPLMDNALLYGGLREIPVAIEKV